MMGRRTIWKYLLLAGERNEFDWPRDSRLLRCEALDPADPAAITAWVLHEDTEAKPERRVFHVYGTGHDIRDGDEFCATVPTASGLVWHVFEKVR